MKLVRKRLPYNFKGREDIALWRKLQEKYQALLQPVQEQYWSKFGMDFPFEQELGRKEIFVMPQNTLLYYYIPEANNEIEAGAWFVEQTEHKMLDEFCERIKGVLSRFNEGKVIFWEDFPVHNAKFMSLRNEYPAPPDSLIKLAPLFFKPEARKILQHELEHDAPEDLLAKLEDSGLINREWLISCREKKQPITKLASTRNLEEVRTGNFKCLLCGRLLTEEDLIPGMKITELGQTMAVPDYWLTLALYQHLISMGISPQRMIIIQERESAPLLLLMHNHHLIICALQEEAKLEDIYLLEQKLKFYTPDYAVYFSLKPFNKGVLKYLENITETPLEIFEDWEGLKQNFSRILSVKEMDYFEELWARFNCNTKVPLGEILAEAFTPKLIAVRRAIAEASVARELTHAAEDTFESKTEEPALETKYIEDELLLDEPLEELLELEEEIVPSEEKIEPLLHKILGDIQINGLIGRSDAVETLMAQFGNTVSSVLTDYSGLPILEKTATPFSADTLASYGAQMFYNCEEVIKVAGMQLQDFKLVFSEGIINIYPSEPFIMILASLFKAEGGNMPLDDISLSLDEGWMHKEMEQFVSIPGVVSVILSTAEGKSLEALHAEPNGLEFPEIIFSQILMEVQKHASGLQLGEVEQITLSVGTAVILILPFKDKFMALMLDAQVSPEAYVPHVERFKATLALAGGSPVSAA